MKNYLERIKRGLNWHFIVNYLLLQPQKFFGIHLPVGYPISAMVEICNICNLRCPLCPVASSSLKREKGMMQSETFRKIVDELDDKYIKVFMPVMWGESLLHPSVIEFMRYARKKDWKITVNTNGNVIGDDTFYKDLVKSGIDEMVYAVDGYDQKSYSIYRRGGNLEKVYNSLEGIKKAKSKLNSNKPRIIAQIHLFNFNENYISRIRYNLKNLVNEVRTKKIRIFYTDLHEENQNLKEGYNSLKPKNVKNQFLPPARAGIKKCTSMLYGIYIAWNGDVIACCGDPSNKFKFGNIKEKSIKQIRSSKRFIQFKLELLRGIFKDEICRKCMYSY